MENPEIEVNPGIPPNAVSLYNNDAMDDFPVLKAFQQYIDAEHAKARKRLVSLGIFFGVFTGVIIAIFVALLMNVSARNQALNDRLIEFAMKDRDRGQAAVVVQPPIQQDNSALMAVTAKLDALQKQLNDSAAGNSDTVAKPKVEAEKTNAPTAAELEVVRLKALLSAEKEKLAEEKKRQKELELEAYRRKHYPELYGEKKIEAKADTVKAKKTVRTSGRRKKSIDELTDEDISDEALGLDMEDDEEEALDDSKAISYFDEDEDDEQESRPRKKAKKAQTPSRGYYSIPVEVKGSKSTWQVPSE